MRNHCKDSSSFARTSRITFIRKAVNFSTGKCYTENMKLIQRYPLHWNLVNTFELTDSKVIYSWESWTSKGSVEYPFSDLDKSTARSSYGSSAFSNIAWGTFFAAVISSTLLRFLPFKIYSLIVFGLFSIALISLFIYLFRKDDYEVFRNKSNYGVFGIRLTKKGSEKSFIEELKRLISNSR